MPDPQRCSVCGRTRQPGVKWVASASRCVRCQSRWQREHANHKPYKGDWRLGREWSLHRILGGLHSSLKSEDKW